MCVTFVFTRLPESDSKWKLIVLNIRDEMIQRETSKLAWEGSILAGRDEVAVDRGTWFGVNERGRVGVLLSITQPNAEKDPKAPSRGSIVTNFLTTSASAADYTDKLALTADPFNGFQFLAIDRDDDGEYDITSVTHKFVSSVQTRTWPRGVHGFGNSPPAVPFQKVMHGQRLFLEALEGLEEEEEIVEALLRVANDRKRCFPDFQLELQTGKSEEECRFLTSLFVEQPEGLAYGTRSQSVLLVDAQDKAVFVERRLVSGSNVSGVWETTQEVFSLT